MTITREATGGPAGLRIIRLTAENVKKLRAVDLHPDGQTIVLGGENGAGKSSVLDAIWYLLGGKEAQPPEPLRRGASKGFVEADLGELVARRTFTPGGGGSLTVRNREGAAYQSPQTLLDKLVGDLSFDPLAFTRMPGREQAALLRKLTGLDFAALDARRAELYQERTDAGRSLRDAESALKGLPEVSDAPAEEVSVAALAGELEACREAEALARQRGNAVMAAQRQREADETAAQEIEEEIRRLTQSLERLRGTAAKVAAGLPALRAAEDQAVAAIPDRAAIQSRLAGAEELNRRVRAARERARAADRVEGHSGEVARLTARIAEFDAEKERLLAAAPLPVPGLGFGEEGVTLNGLPFEQASATEQLMVSLAMGAALNPRLRVLLVKDASLLTPKNRAALLAWCEERGMQGWIELAGEGPEVSVVIEDGAVRGEVA